MPKLEEQLNEQTLKGTVSVNDQNLLQDLIQTLVLDDINDVNISSPTNGQILGYNSGTNSWQNTNAAIADGDKGDITTSGSGSTWTIDNNAVVEAKIGTGAVTETKIGTGAVTETKIGTSAVTETKIANNAVTTNKIADNNVTTAKILDNNVTNAKLAQVSTATVKGRATAGTGDVEDLTIDADLSSVSANDDTIPSAKAVKAYVDILDLKTRIRNGGLINGFIRATVASNNLTVAISTSSSSQVDPTASNPVYVWIGNTLRSITSAMNTTNNAGINWLNMGSSELATKEVDLFCFMQWNSTTNAVDILVSRIPYARVMGDFVNSGINEKGVFGIVNYNSGDNVVNVGRFAATLSAGAGYTWSVPAFTNANLIQEPIYETRWLIAEPVVTGFSATSSKSMKYKLNGNTMQLSFDIVGTSNATGFTITSPFIFNTATGTNNIRPGYSENNGAALAASRVDFTNGVRTMNVFSDGGGGSWTASGAKRAMAQFFTEI